MRSHYFDPATQKIQTTLEKALPNQSVAIVSKDATSTSYLAVSDGPRNPPTLYLYQPAAHQLMVLLQAYPALQQSDLGEMKPYPYKARDGLDIHAYLTLPPGRDPHNLPTIIMPHGGPEDRDMLRFDWVAQFLASRGYAVLQPNFRGSSGYGWPFITAGDGEWANKVQFDVQDGVKKLVSDGVADPKHTCIFGWSYGGYMSLAGATFSPDLYACAAAFAGVYDLDRLLYSGSKFESESTSVWERRMGASRSDSDKMYALSPAKHPDQVKAPILLMHSDKDVTVPIEQSEIEERGLKKFGKQVQFVKMSGDDHQLSYASTRIQMLTELEKFLATNIGH
jgi:dipeptidyl aminopeptidase/acylaminoacyl peptidase